MGLTRSDTILKYIVEYFIKNAEPVGSHTLIDEYHLPYSSATIRNEMFALEKMGYIEKTHSSSGRVPSSKGYKYYCKHLRDGGIDEALKNSHLKRSIGDKLNLALFGNFSRRTNHFLRMNWCFVFKKLFESHAYCSVLHAFLDLLQRSLVVQPSPEHFPVMNRNGSAR